MVHSFTSFPRRIFQCHAQSAYRDYDALFQISTLGIRSSLIVVSYNTNILKAQPVLPAVVEPNQPRRHLKREQTLRFWKIVTSRSTVQIPSAITKYPAQATKNSPLTASMPTEGQAPQIPDMTLSLVHDQSRSVFQRITSSFVAAGSEFDSLSYSVAHLPYH